MVIGEKIPMAIKIGEIFQKSPHPSKHVQLGTAGLGKHPIVNLKQT